MFPFLFFQVQGSRRLQGGREPHLCQLQALQRGRESGGPRRPSHEALLRLAVGRTHLRIADDRAVRRLLIKQLRQL